MKRFHYKVYDSLGNYKATWNDVANVLSFSSEINAGLSPVTILLPRSEYEYGENNDVKLGNQVKIWCADSNVEGGTLIYSGWISRYVPMVEGRKEYVEITLLSYWQELERYVLESGSDTTINYSSLDPSNILKDLLDKFTAAGGKLDYDTGTVDLTGTATSYEFNTNSYQEAIKKIIELTPDGWYMRVGPDDKVYLKNKASTADHVFKMGKHILSYKPEKRTENMINKIYFRGGDPGSGVLYKKYTRSGSISSYGLYAKKVVDERVLTTATMDIMATRMLDTYDEPETRITMKILDNNNASNKGYFIESIKVGQMCKLLGATQKGNNLWDDLLWDTDSWDYDITNVSATLLQIQKVEYNPDYVIIEISNRQPDISKRIEDINRNLVNSQTVDNPTTPTT